jgi:hypothetical protein
MTIEAPTIDSELDAEALGFGDFCDSCGAQAYVRVTLPSGELLFCAHHADRHKDSLIDQALVWHDETHRLRNEPAPAE